MEGVAYLKTYLRIICRWNYDTRQSHWSRIDLETDDKRIEVEHNTSCTKVLSSFQGLFDGGKSKNKADRVAAN